MYLVAEKTSFKKLIDWVRIDNIINKVIKNDIARATNNEHLIILFLLLLNIKANMKKIKLKQWKLSLCDLFTHC